MIGWLDDGINEISAGKNFLNQQDSLKLKKTRIKKK
jgi:hypothetical protein